MISSLPGKALRMLVDIARLAERCVLKAQPGELNRSIKRRESGILFISLTIASLQTSDYDVIFDFCVDSASLATSFKKCNVIMT